MQNVRRTLGIQQIQHNTISYQAVEATSLMINRGAHLLENTCLLSSSASRIGANDSCVYATSVVVRQLLGQTTAKNSRSMNYDGY